MVSPSKRLKLRGRSVPDIVTLSGFVQDALVAPAEMTVEADKRRFVAILNRFMWERCDLQTDTTPSDVAHSHGGSDDRHDQAEQDDQDARFEDASDGRFWRVQSALVIERANSVKRRGMDARPSTGSMAGSEFHYLLSIVPDEGCVTLYFAGGGMIRAEGPALEVFLEDLSEPWPTPQMPVHPDDGQ